MNRTQEREKERMLERVENVWSRLEGTKQDKRRNKKENSF